MQPQLGGGEESKSPPHLPDTLSLPIQAQAQLIAELEKIIHVPMMLVNQGPSGKQRVREAHASGQSPEEQGLCTDALNALGFLP